MEDQLPLNQNMCHAHILRFRFKLSGKAKKKKERKTPAEGKHRTRDEPFSATLEGLIITDEKYTWVITSPRACIQWRVSVGCLQ